MARAGRGARVGARAARFARIIRLIRLIRIMKLYKQTNIALGQLEEETARKNEIAKAKAAAVKQQTEKDTVLKVKKNQVQIAAAATV